MALRSTGHETVPMHDGAGGKKMGPGRAQVQPSPFAQVDPRADLILASNKYAPPPQRPLRRPQPRLYSPPVSVIMLFSVFFPFVGGHASAGGTTAAL